MINDDKNTLQFDLYVNKILKLLETKKKKAFLKNCNILRLK